MFVLSAEIKQIFYNLNEIPYFTNGYVYFTVYTVFFQCTIFGNYLIMVLYGSFFGFYSIFLIFILTKNEINYKIILLFKNLKE